MNLKTLMAKFGLTAKEDRAEVDLKETEELTEMLSVLEANEQALTDAQAQIEALQAQMQEFAEAKVAAEATVKQVKMDARMVALSKDVGDERAKAVLAATEGMEDAQFEAIANALKMSADVEAKTELFTEAGLTAPANDEAGKQETLEMKNLKAKYGKN